jgi:drug/metabolite transporter (DMT)-like permease
VSTLTAPAADRSALGIGLGLAAVACFAALDTSSKYVGLMMPAAMMIFFRFLIQATTTTAWVVHGKGWSALKSRQPVVQLWRGLLLVTSSALAFTSLKFTPVAEFTAIISVTPLVITVAVARSHGERVSTLRWALVAGGFAGVLLIVQPNDDNFHWGSLLTLILVGTATGFQLLTSRLARTDDPAVTHLTTGWIGTVLGAAVLPFVWTPVSHGPTWAALLLIGVLGTVGHFLFIMAYKHTQAGQLQPFMYGQVVFAVLLGWMIFNQVPNTLAIAGMILVVLCGVLSARLGTPANAPAPDSPD